MASSSSQCHQPEKPGLKALAQACKRIRSLERLDCRDHWPLVLATGAALGSSPPPIANPVHRIYRIELGVDGNEFLADALDVGGNGSFVDHDLRSAH